MALDFVVLDDQKRYPPRWLEGHVSSHFSRGPRKDMGGLMTIRSQSGSTGLPKKAGYRAALRSAPCDVWWVAQVICQVGRVTVNAQLRSKSENAASRISPTASWTSPAFSLNLPTALTSARRPMLTLAPVFRPKRA